MARRPSSTLTDGEARLMKVLWDKGTATVAEVVRALGVKPPLTHSTVNTLMRILERKGYVTHEKLGRAFVYRPVVDQRQEGKRALRRLVMRFFENSPSLLVFNVLDDERMDAEELKRLKKFIKDA